MPGDFRERAIPVSAPAGSSGLAIGDPALALHQSLLRCAGCIDDCPVDRADFIVLLQSGNIGCGVGRVPSAAADPAQSGRKVRHQKQPDKPDIVLARGILRRRSLRFTGKHRVGHHRMALRKNAGGALHQDFVDLFGNFGPVGAFRQPIHFADLE